MAEEIDYPNFKNRIASEDPERAHVLSRVREVLYDIQQRDSETHGS